VRFAILFFLPLCVSWTIGAETIYRDAEARDAGGRLLYTELHQLRFTGGKLQASKVIYESADGLVLAAMRSDFSKSIALPETLFATADTDYSYKVEAASTTKLSIVYHEDGKTTRREVKIPKNAVCGQGFSYAITDDVDAWRVGKAKKIAFLFPGRFDYFNFNVEATGDRGNQRHFRMRIANLFFRFFVDEITMEHDRENGLLSRYDGPSNVVYDGDDSPVPVTITYKDSDGARFATLAARAGAMLANAF
jgi:hypothetical protein